MNQNTAPQVPGVMLYRHCYEALSSLEHETVGRLTIALMEYAFFDVEPKLPPEQEIAWAFMKNYVDRDRANYQAKIQRRRDAVEKRWSRERVKAAKPEVSTDSTSVNGGLRAGRPTTHQEASCNNVGRDAHIPPQNKETEPTYDGLYPYRDEKGIIRYKSVTSL